jgi:hypothetical protein
MKVRFPISLAILGAVCASLAGGAEAHAQSGQGFLFKEPRMELGGRVGLGFASAGSDLFDFTREQLTVDDFIGFSGAADASIRLLPRIGLVLSGGYIGSRTNSEFRDWVGEDDLPITQTTDFQRVPLTAGLKLYPLPRGRTIGSYAWIPAKIVPYVGGSAGAMWYRFRQEGDFVDNETRDIFFDELESSGWTPTAEAYGGLSYTLSPRWTVSGEGRYTWASADLSNSFEGFESIDLAGLSVTVGFNVRY